MQASSRTPQDQIHLGTHGEDYGNWMSSPVFYIVGVFVMIFAILARRCFAVWHIEALGVALSVVVVALLALIVWMAWVRRQYSFSGGGLMEKVHAELLQELDYDGQGTLLEVGCGSGALAIRAALTWPATRVLGIDYWGAVYAYSQEMCEKNAASEGVGERCEFRHGDANKLDLPDESVDAVVSNYVYHNISGANKQELVLETLRVLKKGGVFAINDSMRPNLYGDMDAFVEKLKAMGYEDVRLIDTATTVFGSPAKASLMFLSGSKLLVGRK